MNILVTGANGQLGNEMKRLVGHTGNSSTVAREASRHIFFFTDIEELDITDQEAIRTFIEENDIDLIVNCAAFTAVDKAESEESFCDLLNHHAPCFLAESIAEKGGSIIHISTDYVFDGQACIPYREDDKTNPNSVYGLTKLKGETGVRKRCPDSVVIRTAWLYSSFGNNFVKTMIRLGRERKEIGVVADQIGTPTYANDLAAAILQIIEHGIVPGIYHFTNEGAASWYDFTKEIHRLADIKDCKVRPITTEDYPTPARRPHYSVLDKSKIKQTFNIEIDWWKDALARCLEDFEI